jgi:hypothetical protein
MLLIHLISRLSVLMCELVGSRNVDNNIKPPFLYYKQ